VEVYNDRIPSVFHGDRPMFGMLQEEKERHLLASMNELCIWHYERCEEYRNIVTYSHSSPPYASLTDIPMIPTTIFKEYELISRSSDQAAVEAIFKKIQSSSTSSGIPSQIFVDEQTSNRQKKSVQQIFDSYLGSIKRPYIIFDAMETARGKNALSARGAAIMSLMGYASRFFFVMNNIDGQLVLDERKLQEAMEAVEQEGTFLAYGFTYILYQAHEAIERMQSFHSYRAQDAYLLHSGGWKKLQSIAVDKESFNRKIAGLWGIDSSRVVDFYGLVEQAGVIYPDCSEGNKHVPYYADIIIRNPHTLAPAPTGETGLIQLMNALPLSSPNHSILTDDLGMIVHTDQCACGRKGKAFRFVGRAPKAELRGCGDIYTEERGV